MPLSLEVAVDTTSAVDCAGFGLLITCIVLSSMCTLEPFIVPHTLNCKQQVFVSIPKSDNNDLIRTVISLDNSCIVPSYKSKTSQNSVSDRVHVPETSDFMQL